jgi:hypothetical protein
VRSLGRLGAEHVHAAWLAGELSSSRFGVRVREELARVGATEEIVTAPDSGDPEENRLRREVLDACRLGYYGVWFHELAWQRAALEPDEVLAIRYIDWDWWLEVSAGTRLPAEGAAWHRARGEDDRFRSGGPPLIAARADPSSRLVVIEGHARLTALAFDPDEIPRPLEILLGEGESIRGWGCY